MVALDTLVGIVGVALGLLFVWFSKETIGIAIGRRDGNLVQYGVIMALILLAEIGVRALDNRIATTMGVRNKNRLRYNLFERLMQGEWRGLERHHSGDVLNRLINDIGIADSADPKELFDNGHRVKYFLDKDLQTAEKVSFHPCDNTASVVLSHEMFMKFLALWGGEYEWLEVLASEQVSAPVGEDESDRHYESQELGYADGTPDSVDSEK